MNPRISFKWYIIHATWGSFIFNNGIKHFVVQSEFKTLKNSPKIIWIKYTIFTIEALQNFERIISLMVKLSKDSECTTLYSKCRDSKNLNYIINKEAKKETESYQWGKEIQMELWWVGAGLCFFSCQFFNI